MPIFKCRSCKKEHTAFQEAAKCCYGAFTGHANKDMTKEQWQEAWERLCRDNGVVCLGGNNKGKE